jgi:hypothetical protein
MAKFVPANLGVTIFYSSLYAFDVPIFKSNEPGGIFQKLTTNLRHFRKATEFEEAKEPGGKGQFSGARRASNDSPRVKNFHRVSFRDCTRSWLPGFWILPNTVHDACVLLHTASLTLGLSRLPTC